VCTLICSVCSSRPPRFWLHIFSLELFDQNPVVGGGQVTGVTLRSCPNAFGSLLKRVWVGRKLEELRRFLVDRRIIRPFD